MAYVFNDTLKKEYMFEDPWNDYNYKVYEWYNDCWLYIGQIYCKSNNYKVIKAKWENRNFEY